MAKKEFIPISQLCDHYMVEVSFFKKLHDVGLVEITRFEKTECLHEDNLDNFERIMRIHRDLHVNVEGIDVVMNLLEKVEQLNRELYLVKSRLGLYE